MQYHFNELDPSTFQRLVNAILVARYGEAVRLTPLRGADGGRDAETAVGHPEHNFLEVSVDGDAVARPPFVGPRPGRYIFQVKQHRTHETTPTIARARVLSDFNEELSKNVLSQVDKGQANYFFLITNVPSSAESLATLDERRERLVEEAPYLHADVWWQEQLIAFLDQMPTLWPAFPELFAGRQVPIMGQLHIPAAEGLSRSFRMALSRQYQRDNSVKFRQIELEKELAPLFVDLDVALDNLDRDDKQQLAESNVPIEGWSEKVEATEESQALFLQGVLMDGDDEDMAVSALWLLLNENTSCTRKIILEGGPGQGKSTITQMVAQIYREQLLKPARPMNPEGRWLPPEKARVAVRLELREYAEWFKSLPPNESGSVEQFLSVEMTRDAGGATITVEQIQELAVASPFLVIFDGLDEVGSDELRNVTLGRIVDFVSRFEDDLNADLRVIITTRPPAIAGKRDRLVDFRRIPITPLSATRIEDYLTRWLRVQVPDDDDKRRIRTSFANRTDYYVQALARNPMQLSVLLHFIRLKGEAFPSQRAELYRDYFQVVIDRDVEKSADLRENREIIEQIHRVLGYRIHLLTEAEQADRSLARPQLMAVVTAWLRMQGEEPQKADLLFRVGEERLGLVVALKGEGEDTRHGFEIQPVQEYFAAAFINEHVRGNAHDVFEEIAPRTYWNEVALFLAGLRRPNEKADLLARCRYLDDSPKSPLVDQRWNNVGRPLVLRMLQEGIFSSRHLENEATSFVLDLLDPRLTPVQNGATTSGIVEQDDFIRWAALFARRSHSAQHIERLNAMAKVLCEKGDAFALHRVFETLRQLQDAEQTRDSLLALSYSETCKTSLIPYLRLAWPLAWDLDIREASKSPSFWEGASDATWATIWWRAAVYNDKSDAVFLEAPTHLHEAMIVRLASTPMTLGRPDVRNFVSSLPTNCWAVWHLLMLQKAIASSISMGHERLSRETVTALLAKLQENPPSYEGLQEPTASVVQMLIAALQKCLNAFVSHNWVLGSDEQAETKSNGNGGSESEHPSLTTDSRTRGANELEISDVMLQSVSEWQNELDEMLKIGSYHEWLAVHVSLCILRLMLFLRSQGREAVLLNEERFAQMIASAPECVLLWEKVSPYFDQHQFIVSNPRAERNNQQNPTDQEFVPSSNDILRDITLESRHSVYYQRVPSVVRLQKDDELTPLLDLLQAKLLVGQKIEPRWLGSVAKTPASLQHLVRKCLTDFPDRLPDLMRQSAAARPLGWRFWREKALSEQHMIALLDEVKRSDDLEVWSGAMVLLAGSSFVKLCDESTLLRLVQGADAISEGAVFIFHSHRIFHSEEPQSISEETAILGRVAQAVCLSPLEYSFNMVCWAASFLSIHFPVSLPPLLEQEERLGLSLKSEDF